MAEVHGTCDPKFSTIHTLLRDALTSGSELGCSFSVNISGTTVIDLYGGYASASKASPWTQSTLAPVFSATKTVVSLSILHLASTGKISLSDKVSKYWPEFACHGKQDVQIKMLISHTSGVPGWVDDMTLEDLCNTPTSTSKLAAQKPSWEPGTQSGYHCWSHGHLAGEIIRRVTGLSLKQYIAQEIAGKRGGADFQIGCKEEDWYRIAELVPPPVFTSTEWKVPEKGSVGAMLMNPLASAEMANSEAWRRGEVGATNGFTNARGLVDVLSAVTLASSSDDPLPALLDGKTRDKIFEEQFKGTDLLLNVPVRFGIGFALRGADVDTEGSVEKVVPEGKIAYWGGWGGSMVIMDVERGVTCAFVGNKMTNEGTAWVPFVREVYRILGYGDGGEEK
ncbi:beta-lactamase [Cadophora sp. DSE1049]|nr:beta-lactamase [Cadophora sp. DSE1049]